MPFLSVFGLFQKFHFPACSTLDICHKIYSRNGSHGREGIILTITNVEQIDYTI